MKPKPPLILASASPNRLELLSRAGLVPSSIVPADIDETPQKGETAKQLVLRLARQKAERVSAQHPNAFIIAADSTIAVGRRILEKPEDETQARVFLELLSGRRHRVLGGIALAVPAQSGQSAKIISRAVQSVVAFKRLSNAEINAYIASGEWQGKAGGYAIQGKAGAYISFISGSYSNIVGLSLYDIMAMLNGNGFEAH